MERKATIQLKTFCELLGVADREIRYILEAGYLPKGVAVKPTTGIRREFDAAQAFWLAIVLKLKQTGLKTRLAADIADITNKALRGVTQNLSWDWTFVPQNGWFNTDHQYFVEIGDLLYIRLVTDANPSQQGLYEFDWSPIKGHCQVGKSLAPFVVIRVDLTQIAARLATVEGWSCPHRV